MYMISAKTCSFFKAERYLANLIVIMTVLFADQPMISWLDLGYALLDIYINF